MNVSSPAPVTSALAVAATALITVACAAPADPPPYDPLSPRAATSGSVHDAAAPVAGVGSNGVSITCGTREGDTEIVMKAWNSDPVGRQCTATCYYKNSEGHDGSLTNSATVPANAAGVEFAKLKSPPLTFEIINPGIASCT